MTEIKKLEIKHIAPYLPYGLRWRFEGEDITHEVVGLDIINTGVKLISPYYNYGSCEINNGRPLLRPMSDLYKERGGKIDIVKLAKIACKSVGITCDISHINKYDGTVFLNSLTEFSYNKGGNFFLYDGESETPYLINQFELFEYLFANHYDIYGLLDQNLAINLNEIE